MVAGSHQPFCVNHTAVFVSSVLSKKWNSIRSNVEPLLAPTASENCVVSQLSRIFKRAGVNTGDDVSHAL